MDIKKIREHYGYTQETFAKRCGVSRYAVIGWEKGGPISSTKRKFIEANFCNNKAPENDFVSIERYGRLKEELRLTDTIKRLERENAQIRIWNSLKSRQKKLYEVEIATALLSRYHAAGYDTKEKFINAVMAVYPAQNYNLLGMMYEYMICDLFMCQDAEHALEVLTFFKK